MIENYKDLLFAILSSDEENHKKSVICMYDTKDNDKLIAIFNSSKSCGKFLNTNPRTIDSSISKKLLRNRRYRLERLTIVGE